MNPSWNLKHFKQFAYYVEVETVECKSETIQSSD